MGLPLSAARWTVDPSWAMAVKSGGGAPTEIPSFEEGGRGAGEEETAETAAVVGVGVAAGGASSPRAHATDVSATTNGRKVERYAFMRRVVSAPKNERRRVYRIPYSLAL